MDSRIEELAQIIRERAGDAAKNVQAAADGYRGDRYHSWRALERLAGEMQGVIDQYRRDHREEYVDVISAEHYALRSALEKVLDEGLIPDGFALLKEEVQAALTQGKK